ncbi:MAG TPA: glycosyl hydrolase family 8 [Fibrobacteraceae bacterium]|nr:glycosyl hydrolase family 8 [Fibrobacteraceae bacterium]
MYRFLLLLSLFVSFASASVKCGYPCQTDYSGRGSQVSDANAAADSLKKKFLRWMDNNYEESGSYARIKFDTPDDAYTVSEGIGYGMLLMVYFSNDDTSYQSQFDKLWAYYQKWENSNGLMNWKISGFSSITDSGAATDADLDAAVALVMAYYQFGNSSYLTAAKTLIASIRSYELDGSNLLKPGDQWDDRKNPSYVSPAAFDLFASVESSYSSTWSSVKSANYSLLSSNQNSSTGLWTDWCTTSGTPTYTNSTYNTSYVFYFDAVRTPWRLAWAYLWYGHSQASSMNDDMGDWMKDNITATMIKSGYNWSTGEYLGSYKTSAFFGGMLSAVATSADADNQTYLDKGWATMMKLGISTTEKYFSATLQVLTGLMLAGFFPNLSLDNPGTQMDVTVSSSVISSSSNVSSSSAQSSSSMGSSAEEESSSVSDDGSVSGFTYWTTYVDDYDMGSSVDPEPEESPITTVSGVTAAQATMVKGPNVSPYPYVGLMLQFNADGLSEDLSDVTSIEITYRATGAIRMSLTQVGLTGDGAEYGDTLVESSSWKTVTYQISDLSQPSWADAQGLTRDINMAKTTGVKWELTHGSNDESSTVSGSIAISSIVFNGWVPILPSSNGASGLSMSVSGGSLSFTVPRDGVGRIDVFDLLGHRVRTLVSGVMCTGTYTVALGLSTHGVYVVRMEQRGYSQSLRFTLR